MNTPVSFALAKLLKEKGFDKHGYLQDVWLGNKYEGKHPKVKEIPVFGLGSTSVLPTIADVVMWLYEKHDIWIYVIYDKGLFHNNIEDTTYKDLSEEDCRVFNMSNYNSPTEAYESAINYTLKNLIK